MSEIVRTTFKDLQFRGTMWYLAEEVDEKLRIAEKYIYQPADFKEYRKELKQRGLPDSNPPPQ